MLIYAVTLCLSMPLQRRYAFRLQHEKMPSMLRDTPYADTDYCHAMLLLFSLSAVFALC